ncbi:MAG: DUF4093 domain-containing protein [Clostridia bacterium]|nr:DUF4093 domain-containing protein [Clostridia bacterium]
MIKVDRAIIVEGKYDKIKLSSVVDAVIIETDGFRIFRDKEKLAMIKALAKAKGIVILTDSDSAGFMIRNYLKSAIDEKYIINLYIPEIFGKEKRKAQPSKEGKLGVEGMDTELLKKEFERLDLISKKQDKTPGRRVTRLDLFELGLTGKQDSAFLRKCVKKALGLPEYISQTALLEFVNCTMDFEQFEQLVKEIIRRS